MKKMIKFFALAAIAALACVSCNKEIEVSVASVEDGIKVAVVADNDLIGTKTELSGANSVVWTAGDKVGFINGEDGVNVQSSDAVINGSGQASFTGTVATAGTYYAYYPYFNDDTYAPDAEGVTVRISNSQNPTLTSFDPAADMLVSEGFEATEGSYSTEPTVLRFKRLGSFIKLTVKDGTTGAKLSGEYATAVSIEGENNLVGRVKISGANGLVGPLSGYKKVTANYAADTFSIPVAGQAAYFGVLPQTLANGSKLLIVVTTNKRTIERTLVMPSDVNLTAGKILPLTLTITDADLPVVSRLWGYYPNTGWPTNFMGENTDRGVATDGEYVYIAKAASDTYGVVAIKVDNPASTKSVCMDGVDGGFFKTACCRTIYDPNTHKYILLVGSLAHDSDCNFNVYAYVDGIDSAPTKVISWNSNNGSPRRVGDFFTVSGDWNNGEIWARINDDGGTTTTFAWKITAGSFGTVLGGGIGYGGTKGMGSVYKYSIDAGQVMVVTPEVGRFFSCTVEPTWINANSAGINWTNGSDNSVWGKRFGYTPFEFKGKKYIAYLHMYNAARGWLTILTDTRGTASGFMQTLIDNHIVFQGAVQINEDTASTEVVPGATYSLHAMGNCGVAVFEDYVIIVGHQQNTGIACFKMQL